MIAPATKRTEAARLTAPDLYRLPPHSTEHEQAVLGACLLAPVEATIRVIEGLRSDITALYDQRHRLIFKAIIDLYELNPSTPADQIAVVQRLKEQGNLTAAGGLPYVAGLADTISSATNVEHHLFKVQELWRRRKIIAGCTNAIEAAFEMKSFDEAIDQIAAEIHAADEQDEELAAHPASYVPGYIDELQKRFDLRGQLPGLPTGFYDYDRSEGGLRFGEMLVVGARPYEGKTALACNLVERACIIEGHACLFVSLEMTRNKLLDRFTSLLAGVPISHLSRADFNEREFQSLAVSNSKIKAAPLYIVEKPGGMSSAECAASIRRYARTHNVKLVIVDYLQKLTHLGGHDKTTYGVGDTCKRLRHACVQSGVALVCLAQLNREIDKGGKKRGPRMSDLADSKAIEAEADTVVLLDRQEDDRNLIIPKSRNSGGQTVYLEFDPMTLRFKNKSKVNE